MLKRESIQPLYRQLMEELIALIDKGIYKSGQQIPTEPELAEIYGVSRITVRRTVEEMCKLGYLVKRQGKGTFVKPLKAFQKFHQKKGFDFTETCLQNNYKANVSSVSINIVKAEGTVAEEFKMSEDQEIVLLTRLWCADDTPIMLIDIYMDPAVYSDFTKDTLGQEYYIDYMMKHYNLNFNKDYETSLTCTNASWEQAQQLNIPVGEPLLVLEHFGRTADDNQVIYFTRQFIVGSRYKASF